MSQTQNTKSDKEINNYYQIVSDIPFSEFHSNTKRFKNLASQMQIGDSVLLMTDRERKSLITAMAHQGIKGKSRQTNQGFRVWRVS